MNIPTRSRSLPWRSLLALSLVLASFSVAAQEERRTAVSRGGSEPPARVMEHSSPPPSSSSATSSDSPSVSRRSPGSDRAARTRPSRGDSTAGRQPVDRRPGGGGYYHPDWNGGYRYPRYYWGWGWGPYYYWPWWWGGYYDYPYYGRPYDYRHYDEDQMGALDLDVSPERAQIYLDGQMIGTADDFDGFPTYLWLPKGTYDVVIYLDGYQTIARQYSIYPGVVVDVEDRMVPGESKRPEDLMTKTHERRDARMAEEREQEEWADAQERRSRATAADVGRVVIDIAPGDASVYLDGRFLGTASELGHLHSGLIVDPGRHQLEVVRPGFHNEMSSFQVEAGEEVTVSIELERSGG